MTTATANATAPYPAPDITAAVARALAAVNDRPSPFLDAYRSAAKIRRHGPGFPRQRLGTSGQGDLAQASNKAWGLVAETVKAISAHYGGIIHSHRAIAEVIDELALLAESAGDTETRRWLRAMFMVASRLHINFYENETPANLVREGLLLCEELSERLYELFWPEGAPPYGSI